jgi:hypothetical protein
MMDLIVDSLILVYEGCDPKKIDFFLFCEKLLKNPSEAVKV